MKNRIIIILSSFILAVAALWIGSFIYANDFSVPTYADEKLSSLQKVLIIFPHADDEALTSGGLISRLAEEKAQIQWIVLTQGEKGNPEGKTDEKLKQIRSGEARKAADVYGVSNLVLREYPDGDVAAHRERLTEEVEEIIVSSNPDLIITYDRAGLYGHPDHVVTSEVVTEITKKFPSIHLWYASYPRRTLDSVSLPEEMALDINFKNKRVYPTIKIWVGLRGVINKIKAVYLYESQRNSYVSSFPIAFIPLWFYVSLTPFEYYHVAR